MDYKKELINVFKDITSKDKKRVKRQIPNILTLSRALLAPIIVITYLVFNNLYLAFLLVFLCGITDCIDGWYARKHNLTSEFGAVLDTICDKVFAILIVIPLILINQKYIVGIVILETLIILINSYSKKKGYITRSSIFGKVKTVILYFTIALCYFNFIIDIDKSIVEGATFYTIIMQIVSIIEYYTFYKKQKTGGKDTIHRISKCEKSI